MENSNENLDTENVANQSAFTDLLKELFNGVNINDAIESINSVSIEKLKIQELINKENLKHQDSTNKLNLQFWTYKFIKEFAVILIILISIFLMSFNCKIDSSIIGTLLGSVIGYAIGNFSSSNNKEH